MLLELTIDEVLIDSNGMPYLINLSRLLKRCYIYLSSTPAEPKPNSQNLRLCPTLCFSDSV